MYIGDLFEIHILHCGSCDVLLTSHQSFLVRVVRVDSACVHFVIAIFGEMSEHHMYLVFHFFSEVPNVIQHLWILCEVVQPLRQIWQQIIRCRYNVHVRYVIFVEYHTCIVNDGLLILRRRELTELSMIMKQISVHNLSFAAHSLPFWKKKMCFFDRSTHRNIRRRNGDTSSQDLCCRD